MDDPPFRQRWQSFRWHLHGPAAHRSSGHRKHNARIPFDGAELLPEGALQKIRRSDRWDIRPVPQATYSIESLMAVTAK